MTAEGFKKKMKAAQRAAEERLAEVAHTKGDPILARYLVATMGAIEAVLCRMEEEAGK